MLTPSSYVVLAIFIGIIICVIRPLSIRISQSKRIQLDYAIAPLLGVFILLIVQITSPHILITGIIGTATIKPYSILILFFSLAFLSSDLPGC